MDALEKCPFCGGEAASRVRGAEWSDQLVLVAEIRCPDCGVAKSVQFRGDKVSFDAYISAFESATNLWNRRAK